MKRLVNTFLLNPKKVFLIDGFGALLTAFFLFVILKNFNEYFGMPKPALNVLTIIAVVFSFYSVGCFFILKDSWRSFLLCISIANLFYCCLTLGLVIKNHTRLTFLGLTYFLLEMMIVCLLVYFEIQVLKRSNK
jgi:hypothetical protein